MGALLIFGLGFTAGRLAARLQGEGWGVAATGRAGTLAFDDRAAVEAAIAGATHVLSSVPPAGEDDPVLAAYGDRLGEKWLGYLSSTGVYGDTGGAWVDESAPLAGRRGGRMAADLAWQALGARVFRLPGIYGPGRSALERVAAGTAHRIDLPGQVFSRVHVDDIVSGVIAGFDPGSGSGAGAPAGVYNLADDLPAPNNAVTEYACALLGRAPPPLQGLDEAGLSDAARAFYAENRRVSNGKAKRVLGWRPLYPDFRSGLRALSAITSPASASTPPPPASSDQR